MFGRETRDEKSRGTGLFKVWREMLILNAGVRKTLIVLLLLRLLLLYGLVGGNLI